jgi:hypothetical protein
MPNIDTPCPSCHAPQMPAPPRSGRNVYVRCPNCGANCRASFFSAHDGTMAVRYSTPRNFRRSKTIRVSMKFAALVETAEFRKLVLDKYGIVV